MRRETTDCLKTPQLLSQLRETTFMTNILIRYLIALLLYQTFMVFLTFSRNVNCTTSTLQIEEEENKHVPFSLPRYTGPEMVQRAQDFYNLVNQRRSCRSFSTDPVPREVIEQCILAAGTSPSGAHTEPWKFVAIFNKEDKLAIREIVEDEEQVSC